MAKKKKKDFNERKQQTPEIVKRPKVLPFNKISIGKAGRFKILGLCLLVFIVAFMVYANTLGGDFIWDDEYLILNNSQIKSFSHLPNVFKTYVGYGSENINNFYRPIQEISNMVDYFLYGQHPFGFHLTNIVLHALVCVMVCLLLYYLAGDIIVAGVGSLFYAVHPVHSEAIAYIAGRADSLYSLFMLLSAVLFIRFAKKAVGGKYCYIRYCLSLVFFVLAILSKEIVLMLPLLLFLYLFCFVKGRENRGAYKKLLLSLIPYAVIVVIYGYLRLTVLSFADIAPPSVFTQIPLVFRLFTFFRVVMVYFGLIVFPHGLHMERTIAISRSLFDPAAIGALLVMIGIGWVAYLAYKRDNRLIAFGILWFFANLLPVSNIVPINSFIAEHWIYMASVGFFLILGIGVSGLYKNVLKGNIALKIGMTVILAGVLGCYAGVTVLRNFDWKDEITFFKSTLKYHPKNARLYLNLGNTYYEKGEIDNAIEQYRKSIDINPRYAVAYGNIGSAYLHKGDIDKAEEYLIKGVNFQAKYPIAHYNLGIVYQEKGKFPEALKELQLATEQLPQLYQAWNMMGRVYLKLGVPGEAKKAFQRSLAILPSQPQVEDILNKI